jgi:signal transduction histidine kinase
VGTCVIVAGFAGRIAAQYRHASQAARIMLLFLLLAAPAWVTYPTLTRVADGAKRRLIETELAAEVANQRTELLEQLQRSLDHIDTIRELPDLIDAAAAQADGSVPTDTAFLVWSQTPLATSRLTSAVELYAEDGTLVGRFALNLPEYTSAAQRWTESSCSWDLFSEVVPFGSDERRLLHAGRRLCHADGGAPRLGGGSVVVLVLPDYNTLRFIRSQSPYFELFRAQRNDLEGSRVRDVELVVYGWGRTPAYTSSGGAWPLEGPLFTRIYESRQPFWARLEREGRSYDVYFLNDRAAIYALGIPRVAPVGHLVNLAELAALAGAVFVVLIIGASVFTAIAQRRPTSGRQLWREIRASFYRKLFLAFVLASIVPVVALAALTRTYIAAQLRTGIESAAVRTAAVARRVIEEYASLQQRGGAVQPSLDDDLMVEISRVIDQTVNVYVGPRLNATSERDLFASGLLPTRTPGEIFRAIALERLPSFVGQEQIASFAYMLAAAPIRAGDRDAILTVPLTLRQQETEREIEELDRRVRLAAIIFILVGAAIGYYMAERIADPVNRLTRATRRIARGEFDARIAVTSADELRRLVEDFNSMAADLQRQRVQLERTHRLEAWAEMARQVAHEIKNPLTPIQLSAEHLQRVHVDRGQPLTPVLEECIGTILSQVRLLRQISAEFSSFASSPNPHPEPTPLADVVHEVIDPYITGLAGRVTVAIDLPSTLPLVNVDRTLLARALTNVIENALHAMPASGSLTVRAARLDEARVELTVADTGVGMDQEGLRRIFEPYFSTKATGTGLGLTIAKRNIEANRGTISVDSRKGEGTTVRIELPVAG